jgi:hypothetical protein
MTGRVADPQCLRALPDRRHRAKGLLTSQLPLALLLLAYLPLLHWITDDALSLRCADSIGQNVHDASQIKPPWTYRDLAAAAANRDDQYSAGAAT